MQWIKRVLRLVFPCQHDWRGFQSKYGCSVYCHKCGKAGAMMDCVPWGD